VANPKPTKETVCSLCGCTAKRFGGPRRLEWDHVGSKANNVSVGWWLCRPGCHDLTFAVQRRDGDSWKKDPTRSKQVRDGWLVHGLATRLGMFNKSFRVGERSDIDSVALRRAAQTHLIAGSGIYDDDEGSYKRPGGNPILNDIGTANSRRLKGDPPQVIAADRSTVLDRKRWENVFSAIVETDSQIEGVPRLASAKANPARTAQWLYQLAVEGRLEFLTMGQDEIKRLVRSLASPDSDDIDPADIALLMSVVRSAEQLAAGVAEAESLEMARSIVEALAEQWPPTRPHTPTSLPT